MLNDGTALAARPFHLELATAQQEPLNMVYIFGAPLQIWEVTAAREGNDLCVGDRIGDGLEIRMLVREITVTVHHERWALNPTNVILLTLQQALNRTRKAETASSSYRFSGLRNETALEFAASR